MRTGLVKVYQVARPQTNGKAERVIRTLMEMWHEKQLFDSPEHRRKELCRFVNFYNTVKPHRSLNGDTPFEVLQAYFSQPGCKQRNVFLHLIKLSGRLKTQLCGLSCLLDISVS